MRIAYVTAGAAGMFCGSCMRDNTLVRALGRIGHEAFLIPTYTPITTDEVDASSRQVFMGGLNVYLQEVSPVFRHTPRWLDRWLDARWLLKWIGRFAGSTPYDELAGLTLSMLRGTHGHQAKEVRRLAGWLAGEMRPDVVHLTNALLSGLVPEIRARLPRTPVVIELQGDDIFLDALPEQARAEAIGLIRQNGELVAGFQATSSAYAESMSAYFGIERNRIGVVHPGIDLSGWPKPGRETRSRPFTVGYFARICPEKGFHHAVGAFIELKKRVPEAKFHFGGWLGPANRDFYSRQLSRLRDAGVAESAVHLECPSLADKVAFMKGVDLLSVPTEYREPKGLYVLEAWAAGIPVVQPAHGSFPELIEMSGGGVLVAPGSLEGLVNAWVDLAEAPQTRELMGKRGREAVESKFTDDIMASQTASWYSKLA